ncbi:hypothetical protein GOV05_03080 [Candidatus Woesearchaeota archaeon]|nr:hypothetical protein [Candidatus Woesearchaeota archaeon]
MADFGVGIAIGFVTGVSAGIAIGMAAKKGEVTPQQRKKMMISIAVGVVIFTVLLATYIIMLRK